MHAGHEDPFLELAVRAQRAGTSTGNYLSELLQIELGQPLSQHERDVILKSIQQFEDGDTLSLEEALAELRNC